MWTRTRIRKGCCLSARGASKGARLALLAPVYSPDQSVPLTMSQADKFVLTQKYDSHRSSSRVCGPSMAAMLERKQFARTRRSSRSRLLQPWLHMDTGASCRV